MKPAVFLLAGVSSLHAAVSPPADFGKTTYATYFGGPGTTVNAIASDSQGNLYLAGATFANQDFPTTSGAYHPQPYTACANCRHAFAAKIGASGALVWSTYLGGNGLDEATGIAVDADGNAYVAGTTESTDFPVTADAVRISGGGPQGFMVKLDAAGAKVLYGTYLGGSDHVAVGGLVWGAVRGTLVVAGAADSAGFPQVNPVQRKTAAGKYAFVMGWRSSSMTLLFSSLLGGSGTTSAHAAAIGADGSVYITGSTNSSDFPLQNAIPGTLKAGECPLDRFVSVNPCSDAFVTKLSADGQSLVYSTLLGGSEAESGTAIAVDAAGSALVAGNTASADFPLVRAAAVYPGDPGCSTGIIPFSSAPCPHGFVAKLAPEGSRLIYSTYLGGKQAAVLAAAAVDEAGNLWVAGTTVGNTFAATSGADQHCNGTPQISIAELEANRGMDGIRKRGTAAIVAKVRSDGTLEYASYFGGTGSAEQSYAISAASSGGVWFAGVSGSADLPVTSGAVQAVAASGGGFLARLEMAPGDGQPRLDRACVLNSATMVRGAVAPGEIVTIFGSGLGPAAGMSAQLDAQGRVARQLAGTSVTFDGVAAPLLYAGTSQVNAIVPFGVAGKTSTQVVVTVNGAASQARTAAVTASSPGIYSTDMSGTGQAAALNQDGTVNSPANPAHRGTVVSLWITGAGLLNAAYEDGEIVTRNPAGLSLPLVSGWTVRYAGQAPGMVAGVVQLNLEIPADLPPGVTSVGPYFTIGGTLVYTVFVAIR